MQVLKEDALDRLAKLSPEEGIKLMERLFAPMKGQHVKARKGNRSEVRQVAKAYEDQNENKGVRRAPRQMDLFA